MRLDISIYSRSIQKLIVEANLDQEGLENSELGDVIEFRIVEIHRVVVEK